MVPETYPDLWADIRAAYALGPERVYHTWTHVEAMLKGLEAVRPALAAPDAAELAIYYHDVVYDPLAQDNEAMSARRLEADLAGRAPDALIRLAGQLVRATASHRVPDILGDTEARDCGFFLDLDLAVLGGPPDRFQAYDEAIRWEYAYLTPGDFCVGRARVLSAFQARDRLYFSDPYRRLLEEPARANLARALAGLRRADPEPAGSYRTGAREPADLTTDPFTLHRRSVAWTYLGELFAPGDAFDPAYAAHGLLHSGYGLDKLEDILAREIQPVWAERSWGDTPGAGQSMAEILDARGAGSMHGRRPKLSSALAARWAAVRAATQRAARSYDLAAL